jgi:hypothetical protein
MRATRAGWRGRESCLTGAVRAADARARSAQGNVTIGSNASLNAAVTGTTLNVAGGVQVGQGAILVLGCSEDIGCSSTSHHVSGSIVASHAEAVILHNNTQTAPAGAL